MTNLKRLLNIMAWAILVLCIASAVVMCIVSIDEMVSRNESEYLDGGGRHVDTQDSVSVKPSDSD